MKRSPLRRKKPLSRLAKRKRDGSSSFWKHEADELFMAQYRGLPCAVCASEGKQNIFKTVAHHVIPKGRCPRHRLTAQNIVVLCPLHHKFSNEIAPHSANPLAVKRFWSWLENNRPEQYQWAMAHERDFGKIDFREACAIMRRMA